MLRAATSRLATATPARHAAAVASGTARAVRGNSTLSEALSAVTSKDVSDEKMVFPSMDADKPRAVVAPRGFSWSHSRDQTFSSCEKKYWYTYYGKNLSTSVGGESVPTPLAKTLTHLRSLTSIPLTVGNVVHEAIEAALGERQRFRPMPRYGDVLERALAAYDAALGRSERSDSKLVRGVLSEMYFHRHTKSKAKPGLAAEIEAGRDQVEQCLRHFFASDLSVRVLQETNPISEWLAIEGMGVFDLPDPLTDDVYPVVAVPDMVLRYNGHVVVLDWKTGRKYPYHADQMAVYGLYARHAFDAAAEQTVLVPVYLTRNTYDKFTLSHQQHRATERRIADSAREMVSRLDGGDMARNTAAPEKFAHTKENWQCKHCAFRDVCEATKFSDVPLAALEEAVVAAGGVVESEEPTPEPAPEPEPVVEPVAEEQVVVDVEAAPEKPE